jgi:hypothetical protein
MYVFMCMLWGLCVYTHTHDTDATQHNARPTTQTNTRTQTNQATRNKPNTKQGEADLQLYDPKRRKRHQSILLPGAF